jgi:type VI secretion system FHA domain protein
MILTLEVIGAQAADLGAGGRKIFNGIGGTIGRLPDNDWVFPDPYVSGRHALIRYLNGKFFIEDTSTNGVFVNAPDNRLPRSEPHQLKNGDRLYIDAYEIQVMIEGDAQSADARNDPLAMLSASRTQALSPPPRQRDDDRTASLVAQTAADEDEEEDEEVDRDEHKTEWFGMSEMASQKRAEQAAAPARPKVESLRPPAPPPAAKPAEPVRRPPPAPAVVAPAPSKAAQAVKPPEAPEVTASETVTDTSQLAALLAAAGIQGLDPSTEAARTLGAVLRSAMAGLMEVLRARERMKDELRMRGTTFKTANNNPLKFSANVDDAFHNLFVKSNPAYLAPSEAVEDAFRDVRDHQGAILAAMRQAFEATIAEFDPDRLQEEFDRQMKKGSILGVPAKLRYWDMYREKYGEMIKEADESFRTLFGDEFAKAYEMQLERSRAAARSREK